MNPIQIAIIQTLVYADIFSYPLSWNELVHLLISSKPIKASAIKKQVNDLIEKRIILFDKKSSRYAVGKKSFKVFKKRERSSKKKVVYAIHAINKLKSIPTISLIGLSGGLAMNNADNTDDIDIFIITSPNTLWITRLLATLFLDFFHMRRKPGEKQVKNKICLNMFIDENHLSIPKNDRDLFSAHEVLQMKPMVVRGKTYEKFLKANGWVEKYLANWKNREWRMENGKWEKRRNNPLSTFYSLLSTFDHLAKHFQLLYMHRRRTTEIITNGYLRFHPRDGRVWILPEYEKRLKKLL